MTPPLSSRRYLKRIWQVPKTRGPAEYLATLITKALRKHGWPAKWEHAQRDPFAFFILHQDLRLDYPADFAEAVAMAVRITAKAYRVNVAFNEGCVSFLDAYRVTNPGGHFKLLPPSEKEHGCDNLPDLPY